MRIILLIMDFLRAKIKLKRPNVTDQNLPCHGHTSGIAYL